ncbi:RidA family protein [Streptomyces luteogriseus]|uniref:RidA family protein n=1 Tax=Streptomyces luteogriseus TaxID=68233 RepID=UPI0037A2630B
MTTRENTLHNAGSGTGGDTSTATFDSAQLVPSAGDYSHIATHRGVACRSSRLPLAPDGTRLADEPFEVRARQVPDNLDACLVTAGSSRERLISATVHVTDIANWPLFDQLYRAWLGPVRPARAVAGAKELHYGSAVEVHAIAALD